MKPISLLTSLLFAPMLVFLLAAPAFAQQKPPPSPADVTLSQITHYQTDMEMGCKDAGIKRGDSVQKTSEFCTCVLNVLRDSIKQEEWQRAYFYAANSRDREESEILNPHLRKSSVCRASP